MRNLLAFFHIIIIPIIIYFISKDSEKYSFLAIALLFLSFISSFLEWIYLKTRDQESFLKPFADKLLILSVLLYLTIIGKFSVIILVLFILRDIVVGIIRFRSSRDNIVIKGRWYGKIITLCELSIIFSILIVNFLDYGANKILIAFIKTFRNGIIFVSLALSLISIIHYLLVYGKKVRAARRKGTLVTSEKLIVLANQKSGGFKDFYRRRLLRLFVRRRRADIIILPNNEQMFFGVNEKIKPFRQIIIAGGDGSFESALNQPEFHNKSLGFFPLGAGNSYYSYFYKGNRFEYLRSRFQFKEVFFDILELEFNGKKIQTTFLSLGIDAEVIQRMKSIKSHNFRNYFAAGTKVAFGPKHSYAVKCEVDGRKYEWADCFNLIIPKIPFIGYGLKATLGEIASNDGFILGVANVNTHSPFFNKGLRLWAMLLTQLGLNKAPLVSLKGRRFIVESPQSIALQAGGEFLGYTKKIMVRVKRKQKVLVI